YAFGSDSIDEEGRSIGGINLVAFVLEAIEGRDGAKSIVNRGRPTEVVTDNAILHCAADIVRGSLGPAWICRDHQCRPATRSGQLVVGEIAPIHIEHPAEHGERAPENTGAIVRE